LPENSRVKAKDYSSVHGYPSHADTPKPAIMEFQFPRTVRRTNWQFTTMVSDNPIYLTSSRNTITIPNTTNGKLYFVYIFSYPFG